MHARSNYLLTNCFLFIIFFDLHIHLNVILFEVSSSLQNWIQIIFQNDAAGKLFIWQCVLRLISISLLPDIAADLHSFYFKKNSFL